MSCLDLSEDSCDGHALNQNLRSNSTVRKCSQI